MTVMTGQRTTLFGNEGTVATKGPISNIGAALRRYRGQVVATGPYGVQTAAQAKEQVFDHWSHLEKLCQRRFPGSENLAHEGLLYVLEHLETDNWQRVRTWGGSGRFLTYLLTLAARLLTDFSRAKYGHIRMPVWLSEKQDPLWSAAYRLLMVEGYQRREVIDILQTRQPGRERWFIEKVVATVRGRCQAHDTRRDAAVPIEDCQEPGSTDYAPEAQLAIEETEMLEAVRQLLDGGEPTAASSTRRVRALVRQLRPHIKMTEEDRLFLRLRHIDGLKMKAIVNLLGLTGDPYKRYHKIIGGLRAAWQRAGLLDTEGVEP